MVVTCGEDPGMISTTYRVHQAIIRSVSMKFFNLSTHPQLVGEYASRATIVSRPNSQPSLDDKILNLSLPAAEPIVVHAFLRYFYYDTFEPLSLPPLAFPSAYAIKVHRMACAFELPVLAFLVAKHLDATCHPVDDAADFLAALQEGCPTCIVVVDNLIAKAKKHYEELVGHAAFPEFVRERPEIGLPLLRMLDRETLREALDNKFYWLSRRVVLNS